MSGCDTITELQLINNNKIRLKLIDDENENEKNIEIRNNDENLIETEMCAICLEVINNDINIFEKTTCNHVFHKTCLSSWIEKNTTCPYCRKKICKVKYNSTTYNVTELYNNLINTCTLKTIQEYIENYFLKYTKIKTIEIYLKKDGTNEHIIEQILKKYLNKQNLYSYWSSEHCIEKLTICGLRKN